MDTRFAEKRVDSIDYDQSSYPVSFCFLVVRQHIAHVFVKSLNTPLQPPWTHQRAFCATQE